MSNDSALVGDSPHVDLITSTNTGAMITAGSGINFVIYHVGFSTAGSWLDLNGGGTEECTIFDANVLTCTTLGNVDAWFELHINTSHFHIATTKGFLFTGACNDLEVIGNDFSNTVIGTQVDLGTATFNHVGIGPNNTFNLASGVTGINIAASGANMNSGEEGHVFHNYVELNSGTAIAGYSSGDVNWVAQENDHIADTRKAAHTYMHTQTTTTIANATALLMTGTFVSHVADQFTITAAGRCTYNGLIETEFHVSASLAGTSSGGTHTLNHYIAKNGTTEISSKTTREYVSTAVGSPATMFGIISLSTGDYLEIFVQDPTTSYIDFVCDIANLSIARV